MAQNESTNSGFSLPAPTDNSQPAPGAASAPNMDTTTSTSAPGGFNVPGQGSFGGGQDTSSRDLLIGGGILLVLLVAFFFAKNAYANTLVAKRVPPNKANAAGWWLFIFLACVSTGVVLSVVSASKFMTPMVLGPLGGVGLLGLVLAFVSGRK